MQTIQRTLFDLAHPSAAKAGIDQAKLETAITNFNPQYFQPPIHDGHPAPDQSSHSRGFIKGVRLQDGKLVGDLCVDDAVKHDFEGGRLLGHSMEFYRDFEGKGCAIRGLGLVGASPPLQKGLEPLFSETDDKGEYVAVVFAENPETKPTEGDPMPQPTITQEDHDHAVKAAADKARADERSAIEAEASDEEGKAKLELLEKENAELKTEKEATVTKANEAEVNRQIDAFAEKNKVLPYKVEIMKQIAKQYTPSEGQTDVVVFAEGGADKKMTLVDALGHLSTDKVETAIKDDLTRPVTGGGDTPSSTGGSTITLDNFAEQEPTRENLQTVIATFCEKNEGKSEGDAYIELAGTSADAGAWIREAELATE